MSYHDTSAYGEAMRLMREARATGALQRATPEQRQALITAAERVRRRMQAALRGNDISGYAPDDSPPEPAYAYEIIPQGNVPTATRNAATQALRYALDTLDLPTVGILWYRPTTTKASRADNALARIGRWLGTDYEPGVYIDSDDDTAGHVRFARPGTIYLRADRTPVRTAKTALHEARHVWQMRHGHVKADPNQSPWTVPQAERDADEYAYEHLERSLT